MMKASLVDPRPIRTRLIHKREGWGFLLKDQQQKLLSPVLAFKIMPETSCKIKTVRISSRYRNMSTRSVHVEKRINTAVTQVPKQVNFAPPIKKLPRAQSQRMPDRRSIVSHSNVIIPAPSFGPQVSAKAWVSYRSSGRLRLQPWQSSYWVSKHQAKRSSLSD